MLDGKLFVLEHFVRFVLNKRNLIAALAAIRTTALRRESAAAATTSSSTSSSSSTSTHSFASGFRYVRSASTLFVGCSAHSDETRRDY